MPVSRLKQILGMNSYDDPSSLPQGIVRLVENMRPKKATLDTREGATLYNAIDIPDGVGVYGLDLYTPNPTTDLLMAVCHGYLYEGAAGNFATVTGNLASTSLCTLEQFGKFELIDDQNTGILVHEHGRTPFYAGLPSPKIYTLIESFENVASWTVASGTGIADYGHFVHGDQSILFTSAVAGLMVASIALPATLNLATFTDGSTSTTADWISFYCLRADPAAINACSITLGNAAFTAGYTIRLDTRTEWTVDTRKYVVIDFRIPKSSFTTVGAPNWASIAAVQFQVKANTASIASMNLDFLRLEKSSPVVAASANVASLNGIYNYRITYIAENGEESDSSYISSAVSVALKAVSLTNLPIAGSSRIAARNLYRIGGTLTNWQLAYHFVDNVQTTFVDSVEDANIPSTVYTPVDGQPFIPKTFCIHDNYVVIANLTALDGITYPCGVMVSKEFSLDIYDNLNMFEIEPHSGTGIYWTLSVFGYVFVGKGDSIWRFNPADLSQVPVPATRLYGGVGPLARCVGENSFYFLDSVGVVRFDGSTFTLISELGPSKVKDYIKNIPVDYLDLCWMEYFDQTVFVGIPQEGGTYPTVVLAYDVPRAFWYVITCPTNGVWEARCAVAHLTSMYLGHALVGRVYDAFVGTDDVGQAIASVVHLKDDAFDKPEIMKDYDRVFVFARKLTTDNAMLAVEVWFDGQAATTVGFVPGVGFGTGPFGTGPFGTGLYSLIDSQYTTKLDIPVSQLGYQGTYLGLRLKVDKPWSLKEIVQVVRLCEPTFSIPQEA